MTLPLTAGLSQRGLVHDPFQKVKGPGMPEEQKTEPELDLKAAAVEQLPLAFYSSGSSDTKVPRFRRSHHIAAHSVANVGIEAALENP
jgi:hypothetical protein